MLPHFPDLPVGASTWIAALVPLAAAAATSAPKALLVATPLPLGGAAVAGSARVERARDGEGTSGGLAVLGHHGHPAHLVVRLVRLGRRLDVHEGHGGARPLRRVLRGQQLNTLDLSISENRQRGEGLLGSCSSWLVMMFTSVDIFLNHKSKNTLWVFPYWEWGRTEVLGG